MSIFVETSTGKDGQVFFKKIRSIRLFREIRVAAETLTPKPFTHIARKSLTLIAGSLKCWQSRWKPFSRKTLPMVVTFLPQEV